ncbi:MaoC family dehydratase [Nocardioides sp. Iso805N]|uniref:MaoC family dehydratase n=1 Tax=Nocardioides sp. Iso805N TaxID=1283287 RepID=UPI000367F127|nr:MaoC family dehydratase [Nocardioides sp. Iso805N]
MAARVIASSAEAEALVGQPLGTSDGLLIDQDRVDLFADATGDHQWIHVDAEKAAAGPFGGTIAHGYLTLSLVPILSSRIYAIGFGTSRLNYGCNKVRFPTPVRVGSTVRASAELTDVRREAQGTYLTTRVTISVDGEAKPACVAETVVLVLGEDAADAAAPTPEEKP